MFTDKKVVVIGAGLAGVETALFLAKKGVKVILFESKRVQKNEAQDIDHLAELVCTNSLKSFRDGSAHGILKKEMDALGSEVLKCARQSAVPAGDALAVDRVQFSKLITEQIQKHPMIELKDEVVGNPLEKLEAYNADFVVVSTGPLSLGPITDWIEESLSKKDLYFYDAIAPVIDADSINMDEVYFKNRHSDSLEDADYLNIPLNKDQYEEFVADLIESDKVPAQNFEDFKFFEACLPIDEMAQRGVDTLRYSCMKPIGLEYEGTRPYAVIQLRKENLLGSAFNIVGFQNRLKYGEQTRVLRKLPGLKEAVFLKLGSIHRNTFLDSKNLLDFDLSSKEFKKLHFAGQITGVEGYTESAAMGLYVAWQIHRKLSGLETREWPKQTAIGALVNYVQTNPKPVPSSINFGLLPKVELSKEQRRSRERAKIKKNLAAQIALNSLNEFLGELGA